MDTCGLCAHALPIRRKGPVRAMHIPATSKPLHRCSLVHLLFPLHCDNSNNALQCNPNLGLHQGCALALDQRCVRSGCLRSSLFLSHLRLGLIAIQRNVRKFLQLRFWGWWKLYNLVRKEGGGAQNPVPVGSFRGRMKIPSGQSSGKWDSQILEIRKKHKHAISWLVGPAIKGSCWALIGQSKDRRPRAMYLLCPLNLCHCQGQVGKLRLPDLKRYLQCLGYVSSCSLAPHRLSRNVGSYATETSSFIRT